MGKMMEQGPVLVITFNSQQILCVKDKSGKVIEGSEDKVSSSSLISVRGSYSNNQFYIKSRNLLKYDRIIFCFLMQLKREGEEKGKGIVGKFSFKIVCQNIIPLFLVKPYI